MDPDISAWIERLTAKERAGRPESATAAWEELEEILIGKLGPRWRREARLGDPPRPLPGPATPPPSVPMETPEGIDMQGTGPDTPQGRCRPRTRRSPTTPSTRPTTRPRPAPRRSRPSRPPPPPPAAAAPAAPTPAPAGPGRRRRPRRPLRREPRRSAHAAPPAHAGAAARAAPARRRDRSHSPPAAEPEPNVAGPARLGAVALLAGLLIPLFAECADRWNVFAVLSPFELVGVAALVWVAASGRLSAEVAGGVLVGCGALALAGAIGLLKFTSQRLGAVGVLLAVVVAPRGGRDPRRGRPLPALRPARSRRGRRRPRRRSCSASRASGSRSSR